MGDAITEHLAWLDGRLPSEVRRERECDFVDNPLAAYVRQRMRQQSERRALMDSELLTIRQKQRAAYWDAKRKEGER